MLNKQKLLGKIDLSSDLPECIQTRLQETVLNEPSLFGVYGAAAGIAAPVLWLRTHDKWLVAFAAIAAIIALSRMALTFLFAHLYRHNGSPSLKTCVTTFFAMGFSLAFAVAALTGRAAYSAEPVSIEIAAILVAAFAVGLGRGAGAFPIATIVLSFLLFAPLITAAMAMGTLDYFFVGLILTFLLFATVKITLLAHGRTKAQLLAEYRLSLVARTDHLTGLANRAGFEERGLLSLERGRSARRGCVVAVLDLDGFKAVNDIHGHGAGDDLLKEVAIRIKETLKAKHFPVRLGGDEFAVLFDPDINLENAIALGEQILTALKLPHKFGTAQLQISGSVGLACFENEADTFSSIVERADKALYQAKNAGKNQVCSLRSTELSPNLAPELREVGVLTPACVAAFEPNAGAAEQVL